MDSSTSRRQFAKVNTLASDPFSSVNDEQPAVSDDITRRIRKCLDRANHPTTPEAEARAALRVAHKLMQQYSVQQADVYAEAVDGDNTSQISGQSGVKILSNKATVIKETWMVTLVSAIITFFDCKAYSTVRHSSIEWTFYGIALNTAAAAMSFEMVVNLTQEWSFQRKKGNKNSYRLGIANGLWRMAHNEKQLERQRAKEQEAADLAAREKEENLKRQQEIHRLTQMDVAGSQRMDLEVDECNDKVSNDRAQGSECTTNELTTNSHQSVKIEDEDELACDADPILPKIARDLDHDDLYKMADAESSSSADEDDFATDNPFWTFKEDADEELDPTLDFDDTLRRHMPFDVDTAIPSNEPTEDSDNPNVDNDEQVSTWKSVTALTKYHNDAEKIAEDYIKAQDMKLKKGRKRDWKIQDQKSYDDGKVDSQKIDVKRRRIGDGKEENEKKDFKRERIEGGS